MPNLFKNRSLAIVFCLSALLLSACAPYRPEIAQGNVVTKEMLAQIKVGMDKNAVLNAMGTPLVSSIFHEGRWDYVFTLDRKGQPYQMRKITLVFKGDNLEKIVGGSDIPTEEQFIDPLLKS